MKKYVMMFVVIVMVCGLAFSAVAKDKYVIGMSQCNLGEPWRV